MKISHFILGFSSIILSSSAISSNNIEPTYWPDLVPKIEAINDPFAMMNQNQLHDLGTIARFREAQKEEGFSASAASMSEIIKLTENLRSQGFDIEHLFDVRKRITKQRMSLATLPNKSVLSKEHKIPGFITPIEMDGTKVTKFFLVPTAGACIHTPPPPPNQIILIDYPKGVELLSLATPVWVQGHLLSGTVAIIYIFFNLARSEERRVGKECRVGVSH